MTAPRRRTLLVVSQVYVPDPASVGQHMADAAAEMVRRGWRVVVLTSARGYEDPSVRYPARETRDGVEIVRLPFASFGKRSIPVRVLGAALFLFQVLIRGLFLRGLDQILVSTSPPMAGSAVWLVHRLRRTPYVFWSMDVNPDQAVALGRVRDDALSVRVFRRVNGWVLSGARRIVAMDDYMAQRLSEAAPEERVVVLPPWPHEEHGAPVAPDETNPFRVEHGLTGRFVLMYSGNHSPAHPITTFLDAARRLTDRNDILFLFVGGGLAKKEVEDAIAEGAINVRSLPYQPLATLRWSLAAADVHLVSFGEAMVGMVHPCKAYGAMAAARPILLVGPERCPIADLIRTHGIGWRVDHGDVEALTGRIVGLADDRAALDDPGERALQAISKDLSQADLRRRFCDVLDGVLPE